GLGSDPSHAIMQHQANGFGFVIGFTLPSKSDAEQFLAECNGIYSATSFGSVHTSAERRARWGEDVPDGFIRLSVGCEPVEELLREIDRALRAL
ncbi:MAG: PLP-dependent transferase, partial [Pseudomonadota bacterium]